MCLIIFAYDYHPQYPLIVVANRDEWYQRPSLPATYWADQPHILAGRDLEKMGTWMGVTTSGRFAALTNYRDPKLEQKQTSSRGHLVSDFLSGSELAATYLEKLKQESSTYNGFNLLVGEGETLLYYSNIHREIQPVPLGIHGLSNHFLNTPWPKVERGKRRLQQVLDSAENLTVEALFTILQDSQQAEEAELPVTGVEKEWEKILSPIFISSEHYGTRTSTVYLLDKKGLVQYSERTYINDPKKWNELSYTFTVGNE